MQSSASSRRQVLNRLLMRVVKFGSSARLRNSGRLVIALVMPLATLLLLEQRHKHLFSEEGDLPQLVLSKIDSPLAPKALCLRVSVHVELMLVVGKGEAVDAEAVAAAEFDHLRETPALLALLSCVRVCLALHNVAIITLNLTLS